MYQPCAQTIEAIVLAGLLSEAGQVFNRGTHSSNVFVNKRPDLDL